MRIQQSQQWHYVRINYFFHPFRVVQQNPEIHKADSTTEIYKAVAPLPPPPPPTPKRTTANYSKDFRVLRMPLHHARIQLKGVENCSFSYNMPDEGLAKISGYLHVNKASLFTFSPA